MKRFSKLIVALVIALNIAFTGAVIFVCLKGSFVPDSLIVAWFAFTTGELWLLSGITREKVRKDADYGNQPPL